MRSILTVRATLAGAALAAGLLFVPTTPAVAGHDHGRAYRDDRYHRDDDSGRRRYRDRDDDSGRRHYRYRDDDSGSGRSCYRQHVGFYVPDRILFEDAYRYRPYYQRRVYCAPHRHYHVVYSFPVYTTHGVIYRPYTYCRGPSGFVSLQGPTFGFELGF